MDILRAQQEELCETPPADELVALYFAAREWWRPPAPRSAAPSAAIETWTSDIPEFVD